MVATFPPPTYKLPREKPLPEVKPETKWEKYAKEKGKKTGKCEMSFDYFSIFSPSIVED